MEAPQFTTEKVQCSDGYTLTARIYGKPEIGKTAILIAGATGVPQRYYRRFAEGMVAEGTPVITFDFRGVAESRYGPLRGFKAGFLDWIRLDMTDMLDWALEKANILIVGHSFGGHAFGHLDRANETLGIIAFGTGPGNRKFMTRSEAIKTEFLWKVLGPILTPIYGCLPSKLVGIGENLPIGVYRQWKRWCAYPHYWFDDPKVDFAPLFSRVTVPVVAVNSTDDQWAPPSSARAFMQYYDRADLSYEDIEPKDWQVQKIAHMGYFHAKCLPFTKALVQRYLAKAEKKT